MLGPVTYVSPSLEPSVETRVYHRTVAERRSGWRWWPVLAALLLVVAVALGGCRSATAGPAAGAGPSLQSKPGDTLEVDREKIAVNATWSPGQLTAHFQKHGREMPWASESVYDASARETIRTGTPFTYQDREARTERLGFYHRDSNRFVGVTRDGRRITTQFRPDRGEGYVRALERSTYR